MKNNYRNWAELPPELTSSILIRLSAIEILVNAQKVCRSWRRVCKDPSMWTKIDTRIPTNFETWKYDLDPMCRHAVDLSHGGLLEINIGDFGSDSLLTYIADRSSNLRRLRVVDSGEVTSSGIFKAVVKLPLLEELEVSVCYISGEHLKAVGQSCPNLRTLMIRQLNLKGMGRSASASACFNVIDRVLAGYLGCGDGIARAIAETMPALRHLQLLQFSGLSDAGLNAILDNCPNLEYLDIRQCLNVNLVGDWEKQCYDRIKVLRHPNELINEYDVVISDT